MYVISLFPRLLQRSTADKICMLMRNENIFGLITTLKHLRLLFKYRGENKVIAIKTRHFFE